ncbi:hypothetical protein [Acetobacter fallax]|uniref:DUF3224 domain-containing protein n=1 Tax=Acetobacter fallax TaxID=1737473 RepID=A0ABX0K8I0_9PROT|nr:hypothetical protein [Acetobacter fallax]NHO31123.1 hypothetical protein [Acetobacter fallax]NHO34680.1 hypothetical protein [Acetobacter fallax]
MKYMTLVGLLMSGLSGQPLHAQDYKSQIGNTRFFGESAARPATAADANVLHAVTSLTQQGGNYKNSCGEKVVPRIMDLHLDGALTHVSAVFTGSHGVCFGSAGYRVTLVDGSDRVIGGTVASGIGVLQTQHGGTYDLSFSGTASSYSVWRWNTGEHSYRHVTDVQLQ